MKDDDVSTRLAAYFAALAAALFAIGFAASGHAGEAGRAAWFLYVFDAAVAGAVIASLAAAIAGAAAVANIKRG